MSRPPVLAVLALLFGVVLAAVAPAWAQPQSQSGTLDPQAREYAFSLYGVYQQSQYTGNWNAFYTACAADATMTRKAFVSTLLYAAEQVNTNPVDAQNAILFADALATVIGEGGDSGPASIMQGIRAGYPQDQLLQMITAYATPLYPQYSASSGQGQENVFLENVDPATHKYGDDPARVAKLPPAVWALLKPIFTKIARIDMAISFANPQLAIQELDGFAEVAKAARADALKMGATDDAASRAKFQEFVAVADAPKLVILSEMGLSQEFDARLESVLANEVEPQKKAGLLLAGVGQALERGDIPRARQLMARIRPILKETKYVPPALEYGIRTAEFRLARQGRPAASLAQLASEFEKSWAAVKDFRPFKIVADDQYWYYARRSTRYWLRELTAYPDGAGEVLRIMGPTLAAWAEAGGINELIRADKSKDDYTLQAVEITSSVGVTLAILDQTLALLETFPDPPGGNELSSIESAIVEVSGMPKILGWDLIAPGFPSYDLSRGGLYAELLGRTKYLRAKDKSLPPEKAVATLSEALKLTKSAGFPEVSVDMMLEGGRLYQTLGRPDLAISEWKQALALADSYSYSDRSAEAASLLAQEYGNQNKWQEAGVFADQASLKLQESLSLANNPLAQQKLSQTTEKVAEVSVKAAVQANDPQKALAALIKGKEAESAAAQLSGQKEAQAQVAAVEQQKQEVAALAEKVQQLEAMPSGEMRDSLLQKTQQVLASTKQEFLLKSRELRQKYPELYSRVLKFDPLDLPDVQNELPPEVAIIQYFPTDDTLYVFLVTKETFRLRSVKLAEKDLDREILSFVRAVRRAQAGDPDLEKTAKSLYGSLIEPCKDDIEGKSTLVFIPSGRLNILPFACLTGPTGAPLIESKLVLEMAKATDFHRIARTQPKKLESVVAFANATGDLPAAAKEGDAIAAMFPEHKLFKEKQATKKAFLDFGAEAQVLHLATHGESNSEDSLNNYLKLSGDEKVAQAEILALSLENTSIVTLSACNTATGDRTDSKFVASLAEAFWLGGSQSVLASLWAVDDSSTGLLMTEFYAGLRDGKGKALALKDAQLKVRATPGYEHPYYWAGFLLFGDWR